MTSNRTQCQGHLTHQWMGLSITCFMFKGPPVNCWTSNDYGQIVLNVLDYQPLELNGSLKIYFSVYKRWCRGPAWEKGDTASKGQHKCVCPESKEALQKEQALSYGKPIFCARRRILSCCFSWVNKQQWGSSARCSLGPKRDKPQALQYRHDSAESQVSCTPGEVGSVAEL